jgi:hypothetical protein
MPSILYQGVIDSVQVTGQIFNPPGFPLSNNSDLLSNPPPTSYTQPSKYYKAGTNPDIALLFIAVTSGSIVPTTPVSSNGQSGTWTRQVRNQDSTNGVTADIWTAPVIATTAKDIITLTYSGTTTGLYGNVWGDSKSSTVLTQWGFSASGVSPPGSTGTTVVFPPLTSGASGPQAYIGQVQSQVAASGPVTPAGFQVVTSTISGNMEIINNNVGNSKLISPTAPQTSGTYNAVALILNRNSTVAPAPTVTGLSPSAGSTAGGTSVLISGTSLATTNAVKFGTANATSFSGATSTSVTAISPAAAASTVDVRVTTPTGTSPIVTADKFTYSTSPAKGKITLGTYSGYDNLSTAAAFMNYLNPALGDTNTLYVDYINGTQNPTAWTGGPNPIFGSGSAQGGFGDFGSWTGPKVIAVPMCISTNPLGWGDITGGGQDANFTAFFEWCQSVGLQNVRLGWEFNNGTGSADYWWGIGGSDNPTNQAGFTAAWQHVWNLANAVQAGYFKFWWNPAWTSGGSDLFSNYWPGDSYVQVIGPDVYNVWYGGSWPGDAQMLTNISTASPPAFNTFVSWALAHGVSAICLPEVDQWPASAGGSTPTPNDDPQFVTNMWGLATSACNQGLDVYFSWYNSGGESFPISGAQWPNSVAQLQSLVTAGVASGLVQT